LKSIVREQESLVMDKEKLYEILDDLREHQEKAVESYDKEANDFWDSLTAEQQMMAFYVVTKKISDHELNDSAASYRYILYDVFGFPMESYAIGMNSGFIDLHNSILTPEEMTEWRKFKSKQKTSLLSKKIRL